MIEKQLNQIKIVNNLYNLGLTDADFEGIKAAAEKFYKKVNGLNFNVSCWLRKVKEYSLIATCSSLLTIKLEKDDSVKPFYEIENNKFYFELEREDIKHIKTLLGKTSRVYCSSDKRSYKSLSEFRDYVISKTENMDIRDEDLSAVFWLFGEKPVELSDAKNDFLDKICYVFEKGNTRYYLTYDYGYKIKTMDINDPRYNYIDKDRLYKNNIFFQDITEDEMDEEVIDEIPARNFTVIDRAKYESYAREFKLKKIKENQEEELQDALSKEAEKKINNLEKENLIFNSIKFSKNFIEYQGQKIGNESLDMRDFIKKHVSFNEDTDFNDIYTAFVSYIEGQESPVTAYMGVILVNVEKKQTMAGNVVVATHSYVNNIRINNAEIKEVMRRAVCYNNATDYNNFLKEINKCSLEFHNVLNNGLQFDYQDDILNENKYIKLKIIRKQNKNFLLADGRLFRVENTAKLISNSSLNKNKRYRLYFSDLVNLFTEFFKMNTDTIARVIKEGLFEYEEAIRRSEQLLKETLELFKVEEIEVEYKNSTYKGYLVKGKAKQYFLAKDLKIFEYPNMRYVCVIDKVLDNQVRNDKLVNRIYALANDSLVADKIHTLNTSNAS